MEFVPPVPYEEVIPWMGRATFDPVDLSSALQHLGFVTCRTFETPAANTIPLFGSTDSYVREMFGEAGCELLLPESRRPEEKVLRSDSSTQVLRGDRDGSEAPHGPETLVRGPVARTGRYRQALMALGWNCRKGIDRCDSSSSIGRMRTTAARRISITTPVLPGRWAMRSRCTVCGQSCLGV